MYKYSFHADPARVVRVSPLLSPSVNRVCVDFSVFCSGVWIVEQKRVPVCVIGIQASRTRIEAHGSPAKRGKD